MTWLITAYEPFGGAKTNSAQILAARLKALDWQGKVEFFSPVPVTFASHWPTVRREMERYPDLKGVLALGQAEGRSRIALERIALNWIDARIPDNVGAQPKNCRIEEGGPEMLWSNIPWDGLEETPQWERSYSAGTYLCNALMYEILRWCGKNGKSGGFVHIPLLQSQQDAVFQPHLPRMAEEDGAEALARIIRFAMKAEPISPRS